MNHIKEQRTVKFIFAACFTIILFLPFLVVLRSLNVGEHVAQDFRDQHDMHPRRMLDFRKAILEFEAIEKQSEDELAEVLDTILELDIQSVIDTTNSGITTEKTCSTCLLGLKAFRIFLRSYHRSDLARYAELGCNTFISGFIAPEVCLGLVDQYLSGILEIGELALHANTSESDVCALIFGPTCGRISAPAHAWQIVLPPKLRKKLRTSLPTDDIRILHLSDFHYDPRYQVGALAQCDLPLCCRKQYGGIEQPVNESLLSGRFGDLRQCDMPLETIESLVDDALKMTDKKLSHVYLTGDIPPHDVWKSDKSEYLNITKTVYDLLKKRFNVKIFPVIGNHEAVPPNLFFSGPVSTPSNRNTPELYSNLASFWSVWLDDEQLNTIRHGGYYAKSVSPTLKIISLNTNLCYYLNFWLLFDSRDPAGQLGWLVQELQESEHKDQKVHLLGHVPPGSFDCFHTWSAQFLRIVQRFSTTITGQFYGHTHFDEFRVFYGANRASPVGAAFIAPSVTSFSSVNPAYKIFTYREDGILIDAITRSFNLTEANEVGRIRWETEYKAKEAYGVEDLSPSSMDRVSKKIAEDPATFQSYYEFYHRNSPSAKWSECAAQCREAIVCSIRTDVRSVSSACLKIP